MVNEGNAIKINPYLIHKMKHKTALGSHKLLCLFLIIDIYGLWVPNVCKQLKCRNIQVTKIEMFYAIIKTASCNTLICHYLPPLHKYEYYSKL